jgi:hypothetical protein
MEIFYRYRLRTSKSLPAIADSVNLLVFGANNVPWGNICGFECEAALLTDRRYAESENAPDQGAHLLSRSS